MRSIFALSLAALTASQALAQSAALTNPALAADTILTNGKVITVDANDSVFASLAIRDGRIVGLGRNEEIAALAGPDTSVIDLRGNTVTPGFIDSHLHLSSMVETLNNIDLSDLNVESIGDVRNLVARRVADSPTRQWIRGSGWDEGKLAERRYVEAADLDPASPENPVWLMHTTNHYGVVNTAGLDLLGINAETPDPPGGTIDRDATGRPTGVLKEAAMDLVTRFLPPFSTEQADSAIERGARMLNAEGITAVKDPYITIDGWNTYLRARSNDTLTVRVFTLWASPDTIEEAEDLIDRIAPFTRPYISTGDDRLISGGVKILADGSGGARTAWMYDDWNRNLDDVDSGNRGYASLEPDVLEGLIRLYHDAGVHMGIHAVGDRTIDFVVDNYAANLKRKPTVGLRHSLIHGNIPTDHALDVLAMLQREYDAGYPEVQSTFTWWIGDTYAGNFGRERGLRLKPLATFLERGIRFGGGSDYPVTPFAPRYGLWASVARETLNGVYGKQPFGTEEAIDLRTALKSYTRWNAPQLFLEDKIGSLEVGKYADLVVWNTDIYTATPEAVKEMRALMTMLEGAIVYRSENF
jgi:predicted amidohydrolase YtcJ